MDCSNSFVQAIMTRGLRFEAAVILSLLIVGASPCWGQDGSEPEVNSPVGSLCSSEDARLPDTIHITDQLLPPLQKMLKQSPTFRSQCRKIADTPGLYVRVRFDWRIDPFLYRARTTIHRLEVGPIIALVDIGIFGNPVELLAHEFEHLVEQIEGVRLTELSSHTSCAWHSQGDMFETERAIRAGRTVRDEVRAADRVAAVLDARIPNADRLVR